MKNLRRRFPVYSKILGMYPAAYRERYSEQMLQTVADMLDGEPSAVRHLGIWFRVALDFPPSFVRQQASYAGTAFMHETPRYVRRNTLLSFALFLPFILIATANDATAHSFYHTWLWQLAVLTTWIVVLPTIGLLVSITTLITWLLRSRKDDHRSWMQALRDVSHNWPMLLLTFLGLGILVLVLFHDSVHCATGNPIIELRNAHRTLRCIEQH